MVKLRWNNENCDGHGGDEDRDGDSIWSDGDDDDGDSIRS